MRIARVIGSAVSTVKEPSLVGHKLLLVRETDERNEVTGPVFVAADLVEPAVPTHVDPQPGSVERASYHRLLSRAVA